MINIFNMWKSMVQWFIVDKIILCPVVWNDQQTFGKVIAAMFKVSK